MRLAVLVGVGMLSVGMLSACAAAPLAPVPVTAPTPTAALPSLPRSDAVIGQNAAALRALFGTPAGVLAQGPARKLQFAAEFCVLDAYLYPPAGGGEPAVVHVDTRRPTGEDIDRASCVAALRTSNVAR